MGPVSTNLYKRSGHHHTALPKLQIKMGDKAVIAKPNLRNLLWSSTKRSLAVGVVSGILVSVAFKFLIMDKKKKMYEDYWASYDPNPQFERMARAGCFKWINEKVEEGADLEE